MEMHRVRLAIFSSRGDLDLSVEEHSLVDENSSKSEHLILLKTFRFFTD